MGIIYHEGVLIGPFPKPIYAEWTLLPQLFGQVQSPRKNVADLAGVRPLPGQLHSFVVI